MNGAVSRGIPGLSKWGNQVQWAGRQLQYNFTLPILLAGGAAAKFALDNEKAMTRVIKVYGDGSAAFNQLSKTEVPALGRAFEALSNRFGIAQADAINIAADWAAAGASGVALAKSVKLTMETMILGELGAAEATQSLIAIQAQYGESVDDLAKTIDILNMVENQTGISMQGLIQGMSRAAGVARSSGIDVRHLAAMMAALTPAAGSAANAGNALKTMISRLLSPTKEANEVLGLMGVNTKDLGWQSLNGAQRLEVLAKSFTGLSDSQKAVVSSVVASRWQINRFDVLMRDITNTNGYYQKSLESTASAQQNFKQRVRELNAVLESNPQKLKQIWTILQNAMAQVIQPMIPVILLLAGTVAKLVNSFTSLPGEVQKLALAFLLVLAAVGPVARYVGSVANLFGLLSEFVHFAAGSMFGFAKSVGAVAAAPFRMVFSLIGSLIGLMTTAGLTMGRGLSRGFAFAMGQFGHILMGVFMPIKAAFVLLGKELLVIWRLTLATMTAAAAPAMGVMRALWAAFMGALGSITAFGGAVINAAWAATFGAMSKSFGFFRAQVAMAWQMLMFGMSAAWGATRAALIGGWAVANRVFVAATAGAATAVQAIWAALLVAGRTFVTALSLLYTTGGRAAMFLVTGPARILTAFRALPGLLARVWPLIIRGLVRIGPWILRAFTSWIGVAVMAALGLAYAFRDQLLQVWRNIVTATASTFAPIRNFFNKIVGGIVDTFWKLPEGVRNAILAVVKIVAAAAKAIYNLFSYINPFAHHSPSLVENVTNGMQAIGDQFAKLPSYVGNPIRQAYADLQRFKKAAADIMNGADSIARAQDRADVAKVNPSVLGVWDALVADVVKLKDVLAVLQGKVAAQQAVVDKWAASLDAANAALDAEEAKLAALQDNLDALNDAYQKHADALSNFASAPIQGMKAMGDQIFANEQAQKALRLEMLKWEQANGSIEDMRNNLAALAGDIEMMRGKIEDARQAGAGSEITGPLQSELAAMEAQYKAVENQINDSPINEMQKQLEELQKQGEILDLENSLQFDPLLRQIDQLANGMKELPFDQIIAGINSEKAAMANLQPQIDAATRAVDQQKAAVDAATAARDAIKARYDAESASLDKLKDQYDATEQAIRDVNSALDDMAQASRAVDQAKSGGKDKYMSPGAENFLAAAGGDFPDVGGNAQIGREGDLTDQSKLIDEFTKGIQDDIAKTFGSMDMLGPIKRAWNKAWGWIQENVAPTVSAIGTGIKAAWDGLGELFSGASDSSFVKGFRHVWDSVADVIRTAWGAIKHIIDLFWPDVKKVFDSIVTAAQDIWKEVAPELAKFGELLGPLGKAFKNLWTVIKPLVALLAVGILGALKIVSSVVANTVGPVLKAVIGIVAAVIQVFRGVLEFIIGVFSGNWKMAWQGIKDIFAGTWNAIVSVISGVIGIIWGVVKGIVEGIVGFFKWLFDILVGHSIIPDLIHAIVDWFTKLPGMAWDALIALKDKLVDVAIKAWDWFWTRQKQGWTNIWNWIKSLPQSAWDALIGLKDKLGELARQAWDWFWTREKQGWSNIWNWIRGLPQSAWDALIGLKDKLGELAHQAWDWFWTRQKQGWSNIWTWLSSLPGKMLGVFEGIGEKLAKKFTGMWDGIKEAFRSAMNWIIQKWNDFSFTIGGQKFMGATLPSITIDTPNLKLLARGGFVTNGATAIVGEGRRNFPEFVIPTDPLFRSNALSLTAQLLSSLGLNDAARAVRGGGVGMESGGILGAVSRKLARADALTGSVVQSYNTVNNEYHFHGDLSFPNIKSGEDADAFLSNLETLAG